MPLIGTTQEHAASQAHAWSEACSTTVELKEWSTRAHSFQQWPAGHVFCGELKEVTLKQDPTSGLKHLKPVKITIAADARTYVLDGQDYNETTSPRSSSLPVRLPPLAPGSKQQFQERYIARNWHARDLVDPRPFLWPSRAPPPPPLSPMQISPAPGVVIAGGRQAVRRAVSMLAMHRGQVLRPHRPPPPLPPLKERFSVGNPFADEHGRPPPPSPLPFRAAADVTTPRHSPLHGRPAQLPFIPERATLPEDAMLAWALSSANTEKFTPSDELHSHTDVPAPADVHQSADDSVAPHNTATPGHDLPTIKVGPIQGVTQPVAINVWACPGKCEVGEACESLEACESPDQMAKRNREAWVDGATPSKDARDTSPNSKWRKAARFFLSLA